MNSHILSGKEHIMTPTALGDINFLLPIFGLSLLIVVAD